MIAAVSLVTIGIVIIIWEGRKLLKQKKKKEMIVFTSSMVLAITLYSGVLLHLPIPTIAETVGTVLGPVVKPIVRWMKGGSA